VIDWSLIVAEHGPRVWRTVYRLVSHREDALDCYQETFLKAAQYAARHTVSNWPGLLNQMATAQALDCLRRRYRVERRSATLEVAEEHACGRQAPDTQAEVREMVEQLRAALAKLPSNQAEVFCLREIELMSTADVAKLLNVRPDDVATWLHRAKRKLREAFTATDRQSEIRQ
jgi:RNA polymerase sigma-70 factor (ECF subfamily)